MKKTILSIIGIFILINVFFGLMYDYQYSEYVNIVLGLLLVIYSSRYYSKNKKKEEV